MAVADWEITSDSSQRDKTSEKSSELESKPSGATGATPTEKCEAETGSSGSDQVAPKRKRGESESSTESSPDKTHSDENGRKLRKKLRRRQALCGTMWVIAFPVMAFMTIALTSPLDQEDMWTHPTMCVFAKLPPKHPSSSSDNPPSDNPTPETSENCENERRERRRLVRGE